MRHFSRRDFLLSSAAAAAAAAVPDAARALEPRRRAGPNDVLRVAVAGVKGRGMGHVGALAKQQDVHIAAIVDIDERVIDSAMKQAEKSSGKKPAYHKDFRKMLEDKSIDAVSIATTNHTHSLFAVWALQAGKHVYVEKPVSHNVWEGRKVVEASRKYSKLCQTGTQCRSSKGLQEAMKFLWEGKLGKVKVARGLCYKRRPSIGKTPEEAVPPGVDYDLWLGPAPVRPFTKNRFHYNWHWMWDYGNGDLGNQGIHQMDIARWGLNKKALANKVQSIGGRFGYEDDGETPNTQIVTLDYGDAQLIFEVRGLETEGYRGAKIGVIFHCSEGYLVNPSYTSATAFDLKGEKIKTFGGAGDDALHFRNWLDAVKSGKREDLNADIEEGHLSSALCHLGNISYRLGKLEAMYKSNPFPNDETSAETFFQMKEHLVSNGVKPDQTQLTVGPLLTLDPKTERFVGNEEADKLLAREYRKPFVVPEQV
jgi:predicted dehydrogenase